MDDEEYEDSTEDRIEIGGHHDDPFDLGLWLGRWQAFGYIANRCSAADVECLRQIRKNKLYHCHARSWGVFCPRYLGFSRAQADRLLQYLEEFGPNYFHLTQIVRVSPQTYRLIAHALREDGAIFHMAAIPLAPENAGQILRAVRSLRQEAAPKRRNPPPAAPSWKPGTASDRKALRQRLARFTQRLESLVQSLSALASLGLDPESAALLFETIHHAVSRLNGLKRALK
jgi:hypothetical protein